MENLDVIDQLSMRQRDDKKIIFRVVIDCICDRNATINAAGDASGRSVVGWQKWLAFQGQ